MGLPSQQQRRQILLGYLYKHVAECGTGSVAPELLGMSHMPHLPGKPSAANKGANNSTTKKQKSGPAANGGAVNASGSAVANGSAGGSAGGSGAGAGAGAACLDLDWVASATDGFSGSDLLELCSQAAQHVLEEHWIAQTHRCESASV